MMNNRSVPVNTLLAHVVYHNVEEAIAWLVRTFGFTEHYRYGDPAQGAQLHLGDAWIMLKSARANAASPVQVGRWTQSLTVFVEDVDAHHARTKSFGARITEELNEPGYGERQYAVEDLEGHIWLFSTHVKDVGPDEWGAIVARR